MKVPLTRPSFSESEVNAVRRVLKSGWVTQGPVTEEFEKLLENFLNAKYAVCVSNCTTALHLSLLDAGIGEGDEVIVPSLTYIATVNSILYVRAQPIFADIDLSTYTVSPQAVAGLITKKTKAILVVHQIGLAADLAPLRKIARQYNLILIEDAAPALGAKYRKEFVGEKDDYVSFSFHPRKSITTGEGGLITTRSNDIAQRLKIIRSHGASKSDFKRHSSKRLEFEEFKVLGYNYRLSDIQAAIGIEQLKKLPVIIKKRRKLAHIYNRELDSLARLILPTEPKYAYHTYQSYQIRIDSLSQGKRDELIQKLLQYGIVTRRGVMATHLEPLYHGKTKQTDLPNTEKAFRESLIIPLFPDMQERQQMYVIQILKKELKKL